MPTRTLVYTQIPWTGGLNDSVDPGLLPASDLVQAENVEFTTSQTRRKRDALEYFDSAVPAVTHRSSSGTTRTLVFASSVLSGTDEKLVVGEKITVTGHADYAVSAAAILTITTTTNSNDTITYTGDSSVNEGSTATSALTVVRASSYICLKDYWRTDSSYVKVQRFAAVTNQGKLFYFNSDGKRFEIKSHPQEFTVLCGDTASLSQSDYFDFNSLTTSYRVWYDIDAAGVAPAAGGRTLVEVNIATGNTAAQVASVTQAAIDALSGVTASVNTATVTVVLDDQGSATAPADGNTAFTITLTKTGRSKSAPFSATITKACMEVMNDVLLVAFDGVGNKCIRYRPETDEFYYTIGGTPPDFSVMRVHHSRLFTNDKVNIDRLNISSVGDFEEWNGTGTSAALDIFPGDGDADGLQSIFIPFRSVLFVAKSTKLYRITGADENDYSPDLVTAGLGCQSHKSISSVDLDDVLFVSARGIHSLAATDEYGDFNAKYLSNKIQNTFNEFTSGRHAYIQSAYVPDTNAVFFAVTDEGASTNDTIYSFNTRSQEWTKWAEADCQSLGLRRVGSKDKLIIGTSSSRLIQSSEDTGLDFTTTPFQFKVKTGTIYPQGRPDAISFFKRFSLFYKPRGTFTLTVKLKIDNQPMQSLAFTQTSGADKLGETFTLGDSLLGSSSVLAPYEQQIEGVGRGVSIELSTFGQDDNIEVYGFSIEYEPADRAQEVQESPDSND